MIDKIDAVVKSIGLSPYAVVAGLFLSAIPVAIGIYRSTRVFYSVVKDLIEGNFSKRNRIKFFKNARIAYEVRNKRRYDVYMFRALIGLGSIFSFSVLYLIAAISSLAIILSFGPENGMNLLWKMRMLLFASFTISVSILLVTVPRMIDTVSVSKLRQRILEKKRSK